MSEACPLTSWTLKRETSRLLPEIRERRRDLQREVSTHATAS